MLSTFRTNSSSQGQLCLAQVNKTPHEFLHFFSTCVVYPAALIQPLRLTSSKLWEGRASHVGAQASPEKALRNCQHSHDLDCVRQMC